MNQKPRRLNGIAADKWKLLANEFNELNALEIEQLTQYCEQFALYIRASNEIAEAEALASMAANGASCPIASIAIQNKAIDQMRRLFQLLSPKISKATDKEDFNLA